jgi:hypothetical protein
LSIARGTPRAFGRVMATDATEVLAPIDLDQLTAATGGSGRDCARETAWWAGTLTLPGALAGSFGGSLGPWRGAAAGAALGTFIGLKTSEHCTTNTK